jgi:hypothetical protein
MLKYSRKLGVYQAFHLVFFRAWLGRSEFQVGIPGIAHPVGKAPHL